MNRRLGLLCFLLAALSAAPAAAKLPSPPNHLIVPNVSAGGVSIGMKISKAKSVWGSGSKCGTSEGKDDKCTWDGGRKGSATLFYNRKAKKVTYISLVAHFVKGKLKSYSGVKKFKTKAGIHVGSTLSAAAMAYPSGTSDATSTKLTGAKAHTYFQDFSDSGKVTSIAIVLNNY